MRKARDLRQAVEHAEQLEELRAAHGRTLRQLAKAKASKEDLVEAVYRAAKDAALAIGPQAPIKAPPSGKPKDEWALLHLTDLQLGKKTRSYSSSKAEQRVVQCVEKSLRCTEIQRKDHPVSSAALLLGGDMVEGVSIFPTQAFEVDASLYEQLFSVAGVLERAVRTLLTNFDRVEVFEEWGNHGRIGRYGELPAHDNVDRMSYRIARDRVGVHPRRLAWRTHESFYNIVTLGAYRALLVHGDEIKGFGGNIPAFGIMRKCIAWAAGVVEPFQDVYMGHWHRPDVYTLPAGGRIFVSASTESGNEYAREFVASAGQPAQRLNFVDPVRGRVTAEYVVWLD